MLFSVVLLLLYSLKESQSETQFKEVAGPDASLAAAVGEDLVLPCFLKPIASAVDMTVEWLKLEGGVSIVHAYEDHEDRNENQAQSYKGRTSLFKEEMQKGNVSLKLSSLQVSDGGKYKCHVEDKFWFGDITVILTVEIPGSHPVVMLQGYDESGGINVMCESRGWNAEPEIMWLDEEGVILSAKDTHINRDINGVSVKQQITVYDSTESNRFFCRLRQKHHMMETQIIINSEVFKIWKYRNVYIGLLGAGLLAVAVMAYVIFHDKKDTPPASPSSTSSTNSSPISISTLLIDSTVIVNPGLDQSELQRQREKYDFIKKKMFAVAVTLDADSAHPELIVSADQKEVTHGNTSQDLPDTPKRFGFKCVVGQHLSSEKFYYEVQVRGKTSWVLGVIDEQLDRKNRFKADPKNGLWLIKLHNENKYYALAKPQNVSLSPRKKVEKVGVFVDYDEELVSFYDVEDNSVIYSFNGQSLPSKLCPYFSPGNNKDGENSAPLIITAVSRE